MFNFETTSERVNESSHTNIETASRQVEEPYINNTNIINSKQNYEPANQNSDLHYPVTTAETSTESLRTGSKKFTRGARFPAAVEEAIEYFKQENSTNIEAQKFYNYFQSNGWKVGGRTPMKDWQAAARNWILNAKKFNNERTGKPSAKQPLNTSVGKDYSEPL